MKQSNNQIPKFLVGDKVRILDGMGSLYKTDDLYLNGFDFDKSKFDLFDGREKELTGQIGIIICIDTEQDFIYFLQLEDGSIVAMFEYDPWDNEYFLELV